MPFCDDIADCEPAPRVRALATCALTDAHRLAVLAELWAETDAGQRWVPLAIAASRYESRIRESLSEKAAE